MGNHLGNDLCRLIRQRSYAAGELQRANRKLEQSITAIRTALAERRAAKRKIQATLDRMAELDSDIAAQSVIDVEDIYAREPRPKRHTRTWGRHLVDLTEFFRAAEGKPLTTSQLVDHMAGLYEVPRTTPEERRVARKWVTAKLQYLVRRGAVKRLHDTENTNLTGLWLWLGI